MSMSATSGGDVEKAWFYSEDTSEWFEVQYNPVNFKWDRSTSWKEHEAQGLVSGLEFQKIAPATMSFELLFDTTSTNTSVKEDWIHKFLKFTQPEVTVTSTTESTNSETGETEQSTITKNRPHKCTFLWNDFELIGVIESVSVTYLMFTNDGMPVRAKATIKMKEWETDDTEYEIGSDWAEGQYGSTNVKLVTASPGDTITAIALENDTSWRGIADANGIDNPMEMEAGQQLATASYLSDS